MSPGPRAVLSLTFVCIYDPGRCQQTSIYFFTNLKNSSIYFLSIVFSYAHTCRSNFVRKATDESVFTSCSLSESVLKCFIGDRDNDQIGGFHHTLWYLFPDVGRVVTLLTN